MSICRIQPNMKTAWYNGPDAGTGTQENPLHWNSTGYTSNGYYYVNLPTTQGMYGDKVDAWVYGRFEQGQSYNFRLSGFDEWSTTAKVYDADGELVATGYFDDWDRYEFVIDLEPAVTGLHYFHLVCDEMWAGTPSIGANPAPATIAPFFAPSVNRARTTGFDGNGRMYPYMSVRGARFFPGGVFGSIFAAGDNDSGQLGVGDTDGRSTFTKVGDRDDWISVGLGSDHAIGVRADGTLWGWGGHSYGRTGHTKATHVPLQVGTFANWRKAYVGRRESYAINDKNEIYVFGYNNRGQLGTGNTTNQSTPTKIAGKNWLEAHAGWEFSLALTKDGRLYSSGYNGQGQLGLGDATQRDVFTEITGFTWRMVAAGYSSSYGIATDGTLWGWGDNNSGQLGLGDTTKYNIPTQIGAAADWTCVTAGGSEHMVAINNNGEMYGCGYGGDYRLGQGDDTSDKSTLVRIGADSDWAVAVAGAEHTLALKRNGELWGWGYNTFGGPLGLGHTNAAKVPTKIPVAAKVTYISCNMRDSMLIVR